LPRPGHPPSSTGRMRSQITVTYGGRQLATLVACSSGAMSVRTHGRPTIQRHLRRLLNLWSYIQYTPR
jgi:hypothetical protein